MKSKVRKFVIINIGLIILTCGMYFFLIPSNLAVGGTTGLAMVVSYLIPEIPISIFLAIINVFLLIIAFIMFGKAFGANTIYSSLAISGMLAVLELTLPMNQPFTDDLFINLIFGIFITGVGMGIVFNQNASTGGTDIIAKIINKFAHIDIGKSLLIADFFIVLFAAFVFGARLGMYALLGVVINSFVIDKMISGFSIKINMLIISNEYKSINKFILDEVGRGTTIYHATGGYSEEEKSILNTIVSRREYIRIRDFVRDIDERAFLSISYITEVEGEGFTFN